MSTPSATTGAAVGTLAVVSLIRDHWLFGSLVAASVTAHAGLGWIPEIRTSDAEPLQVRSGIAQVRLQALRKQAPQEDFKPQKVKKKTDTPPDLEPTPKAETFRPRDVERTIHREVAALSPEDVRIPPPQKREIPPQAEEEVAPQPVVREFKERLPDAPVPIPVTQAAQDESSGAKATTNASLVFNPEPAYPAEDLLNGRSGRVELKIRVSATGTVERAEVLNSTGTPQMEANCLEAIRLWKFKPATNVFGAPVPQELHKPFNFNAFAPKR